MNMAQTQDSPRSPNKYNDLSDVVRDAAQILRPPERLSVSEAAAKYRRLNNPGAYSGPWKNEKVPYMVEPQDVLASRDHNAMVFVGPAQCGKTDALILNWLTYSVVCDPGDMMVVQTSNLTARDFSRRRIDRLHRHSPEVGMRLMPGGHNDNTFDKFYRNGMMLSVSWPSINELSGKPIGRVILTDYDRMDMDVDGEGAPFDLARKRTTTFRSFAMTAAESSPGKVVTDPKWIRRTPHEAPPCEGILALYNRGDRRRWYWPCPHCGEFFEPNFDLLLYDTSEGDIMRAAESAIMVCPKNGCAIEHKHKAKMNSAGVWLKEGETIDRHGVKHGVGIRSDIASFWMKGVAAAFASWKVLVMNYLKAQQEYERTGAEEALKSTVNTDQGEPYVPKAQQTTRLPEVLKERADEIGNKHTVPESVRMLIATIDVQNNRFEVQVHGVEPGSPFDLRVIDRFAIIKSERKDEEGERLWVKPSAYPEDWDAITREVLEKEYPLQSGEGFMQIALTLCDSGGRAGVTTNAYNYYRRLRKDGKHSRFLLVKGDNNQSAPRAHITYPDSAKKDQMAQARGEIPVLMLNVNSLKDTLNGMLDRTEAGGGKVSYPSWLPDEFFTELTVEQRGPRGWENPRKHRNEAWDLLVYALGACVYRRIETVNWDEPPEWLAEHETNSLVRKTDQDARFTPTKKVSQAISDFAKRLG
jgi:phage terminase large subunit GpA-like protein